MKIFAAEVKLLVGIPDHDIRITAYSQSAFLGEQAKDFCRVRGNEVDELMRADSPGTDTPISEQVLARLDAGHTIGDN